MEYQWLIDRVDHYIVNRSKTVVLAFLLVTAVMIGGLGAITSESGQEQFIEDLDSFKASEDIREKFLKAMPIVVIDTDDKDSAFILFETLNERGLELSNVDLMNNSLLKISDINTVDYDLVRVNWANTVSELSYAVDNY